MSRDALFQLGIVPVSLNTSQTEDKETKVFVQKYRARYMATPLPKFTTIHSRSPLVLFLRP
jgi:acyl-CoA synthetase (AMP-forming)/AMP-acid ligase II